MRIDAQVMVGELPLAMAATTVTFDGVADDDEVDAAIPAELRRWLVRLRLLEGVPFANLVADTDLLPPESIRWFYVDRMWSDALVQGALSVGTVNTDDRAHLTAAYPAAREELDAEERNVRRRRDTARMAGPGGPVSGFVLRSAAVAGWPGMHVRAFSEPLEGGETDITDDHPKRMRLLRLERLAPAVLLCLFDGVPAEVHIEEPRQGIQFGVEDASPSGSNRFTAEIQRRDGDSAEDLAEDATPVPLRPGGDGVVHVQALAARLATGDPTTDEMPPADYSSAELTLQLLRFPYRQRFGERLSLVELETWFRPTIGYTDHVAVAFRDGSV